MKWTTWLLFGLALSVCAALFAMAGRRSARSPVEFFSALQTQIDSKQIDDDVALSNLDLALAQAEESANQSLADDVLLARGKILLKIGSWERAKADLELVNEHRGSPSAIDALLTEVETRSGDLRAAQSRVRARVERDSTDLEAWRQIGLLYARSCTQSLESALSAARRSLVPADVVLAETICARLSALDRSDPVRVAWSARLRALYGPDRGVELEQSLTGCDAAADDTRRALEAFGHVLRDRADTECIARLFEILHRAGRSEELADVAAAAIRVPDVRNDVACATRIVDTLIELERPRFATQVCNQWVTPTQRGSAAPASFYAQACRALFATGSWNQLFVAALKFREVADTPQQPWFDFFIGISRIRQPALGRDQTLQGRIDLLARYLNSACIEPLPNARAIAWREAANASHILGEPWAEREQLRGSLDLDPSSDGELWLRLAELSRDNPNASLRDQETHWARGMALLPKRTQELLPRWIELGDRELRAAGVDPIVERTEQVTRGVWTPPPGASPYELYRLGQVHFDAGDTPRAAQCALKLLLLVPELVPAIDLAAACAQREGRLRDLADLAIRRVRAVGSDEATRALLRRLRIADLGSSEILDLMRGDPAGFGRALVARTLHAHGDPRGALKLLESMEPAARNAETRDFAGRIALELGEPARALGYFSAGGPPTSDATLYLLAALRAGDDERLRTVVDELATRIQPQKARWLPLADQLLAANRPALAKSLLDRLDESPVTRGGDVVMRLAQVALITRDRPGAEAYLDRAQAFDTEFAHELGRLELAADTQTWEDVERWATALSESKLRATPLQRALLALLSGHRDTALGLIAAGVAKEPRVPAWRLAEAIAMRMGDRAWEPPVYFGATIVAETSAFLVGTEKRGDARFAAALLFASTMPSGTAWTGARIEAFPKRSRGTLWRNFLLGQQAAAEVNLTLARQLFEELVTLHPGFGPAWDALERLPLASDAPESAKADLRERRIAALGTLAGTPADRALDQARSAALHKDWNAALESARKAAELAPEKPGAYFVQAQVFAAQNELASALAAQRKGLELAGDKVELREVERHLGLLSRAQTAVPPLVTPEELDREVGALSRAHPDDPRVVVAAARVDLRSDADNAPIGVARALARLQGFRARHENEPLDRLAPGSLTAWSTLLSEIDPERAAKLLERERALEPGNPDVWLLAARAAAQQGEFDTAIRDLATLAALVPNSGAARERLRWLARRESRPEELTQAVDDVLKAEGLTEPDAELLLLRAEGQWVLGPRNAEAVLGLLETLMGQKLDPPELEQRRDWLVALASICRGKAESLATATASIDQLEAQTRDPHRKVTVAALHGIVHGTAAARAAQPLPE